MTPTNLAKRLDAIEARRRPAGRVFVCRCGPGEHKPDCPARTAGDGDHVIRVLYADDANPHNAALRRYDGL